MGKIKSIELVIEKLNQTHEGRISMLKFYRASEDALFKCNICQHEWWAMASKASTKTGCPNCQIINGRLTKEYISNIIKANGCVWLSGEYINSKSVLTLIFECGHSGNIVYNEFQQGKRCVECGIKQRSYSHRTKVDDIILFLEDNGLKFIDFPTGMKTQKTSTVRYECELGHVTERVVDKVFQYPTCNKCKMEFLKELHRGENNHFWKGGTTEIRDFCANQIYSWKEKSKIRCGYKCVITGDKMEEVHHIYPFGKIIYETLDNLGLSVYEKINDYTENEMNLISEEIVRLHNIYPLGVCVTKKVHKLFHKIYGRGDTYLEQWYEFVENIENGNIEI